MDFDGEYICEACGETIIIPIDVSAGHHQEYVEDCPVCCHPNVIHVDLDRAGHAEIHGNAESDLA
ncbi:MAG: CPXCG motif-containing cysteine-rich protein [Phycisphaerae bacterium]